MISGACEVEGVALRYLRTGGAKTPLVLLHGLMGNGACWTPVARALEGEHDVVMPDARGHGGSTAPAHGYRYDDLAGDVIGLIRALGLASPIVLGHSMGGMTAAVVAARAGRAVRGVVLVDPTFLSPAWQQEVFESDVAQQHRRMLGQDRAALLDQLRARHPRRSAEMIELLVDARLATRLSAFDVLTPPNPEYRQLVSAIEVPILLLIGDTSPVVSPETARTLQQLNPRLRFEQIQGAGHGLPFDQPLRLAEAVRSFTAGLEG